MNATILRDVHIVGELLLDVGEPLLQRALRAEQGAVGAPQLVDRLAREAAARQPDDVQAAELGAVADRRAERDHVVLDARHAADETALADAHILVHCRQAAEDGVVVDAAMAAERRVVDEDDVVADLAVMGDMRADEKQAVVADPRQHPAALGAGIDGHVLADDAVPADLEPARLAVIFPVLRRQADACEGKDLGARADRRVPAETTWPWTLTPSASRTPAADERIRADRDAVRQLRPVLDDRSRMNVRQVSRPPASRSLPPRRP